MEKGKYAGLTAADLKSALKKGDYRTLLGWTFWFIWEDNSVWSWIANIILAFLLIYFIVYPVLGGVLATSHPIVAVVSGSMEHDGSFDEWWNSRASCPESCTQSRFYSAYNISEEDFESFKFRNGFNMGDIITLKGTDSDEIEVGDVIVFKSTKPDPIIHRVVDIWQEDGRYYFKTKGDHNPYFNEDVDEEEISESRVIGKATMRIPFLGWIKIVFSKIIGEPYCRTTNYAWPCRG